MDLSKLTEKAQELSQKAADALRALTDRLKPLIEKRKPLVLAIGAAAVLFLVLLIIALALKPGKPEKSGAASVAAGPNIPPEELFIPAEPDFVPEYILEKDPRRSWSAEDVHSYWKNPPDPDFWRERIHSAVDELMESVP